MNLTPLALFAVTFASLLAGYPVALTLAGVALIFAFVGTLTGAFNPADLGFAAGRLFGIITNQTLIAVPLFVFMGVLLEKTRIAEDLCNMRQYARFIINRYSQIIRAFNVINRHNGLFSQGMTR